MPRNWNRTIDICLVLLSIATAYYLTAFLMHKDCKYNVVRVAKRCNLPIKSQTIVKTLDDNVVDAEDLLDMENKWLTFRARLRFTGKVNKVSVEIVRLYSTAKKTSEWRMDPTSATAGDQWFTFKGRWIGEPLSFEFAQIDSKIITVPGMTTQDAAKEERLLPNVNNNKQTDSASSGKSYLREEASVPRPQEEISHDDVPGGHASGKSLFVSSDICPVTNDALNTSSNIKATKEPSIIDGKTAVILKAGEFSCHTRGRVAQPKCPLFQEYNASNLAKDTCPCLETVNQTTMTDSFTPTNPSEQDPLEPPMSEGEASTDVSGDDAIPHIQLLEGDCAWYSPTHVLVGAASVATVTVTVATSYVMMVHPNYFWAH